MTATLERGAQIDAEARMARGWCDGTCEQWLPIPGHPGYETNGVDFRGIDRIITRRNGFPYTVKGRKLKISTHNPSGLPVVKLSNGRAGGGRWCYVHLLLAATKVGAA
ncbi:MAG: hypothetical protein WA622_17235 [Mycobacterium sp.]|uniref:hypothetical protein n=1 Tax=Mycobacterium sp. TaxID=1785 RepID=UPI003BB7B95A